MAAHTHARTHIEYRLHKSRLLCTLRFTPFSTSMLSSERGPVPLVVHLRLFRDHDPSLNDEERGGHGLTPLVQTRLPGCECRGRKAKPCSVYTPSRPLPPYTSRPCTHSRCFEQIKCAQSFDFQARYPMTTGSPGKASLCWIAVLRLTLGGETWVVDSTIIKPL